VRGSSSAAPGSVSDTWNDCLDRICSSAVWESASGFTLGTAGWVEGADVVSLGDAREGGASGVLSSRLATSTGDVESSWRLIIEFPRPSTSLLIVTESVAVEVMRGDSGDVCIDGGRTSCTASWGEIFLNSCVGLSTVTGSVPLIEFE